MSADPREAPPITGLVAAVFTPFTDGGELALDRVPGIVAHLEREGIAGIYICGSTGEGPSLTREERMETAEAYLGAAREGGRLRTVVHIGHTAPGESRLLAGHAAAHDADAISAVAPYYFRPPDVGTLVEFMRDAASAAPGLPFYYYHIPSLTGVGIDPAAFLERGAREISNLRGIKFTDADLSLFTACREAAGGGFDVLFGRDEMLLSGLAAGAAGAVGSTYNFAPALYRRVLDAFSAGDLEGARRWQGIASAMVRAITSTGGEAAIKFPMAMVGLDCGPRRPPMRQPTGAELAAIELGLDALGFGDWATSAGEGNR